MSRRFTKFCAAAVLAVTGAAMIGASFDADARRMGGGSSYGRQSSNVMQQRQAVTPPSAATGANSARSAAAPAAAGAAAGATAARSGMSRWLGPIAGIAAGLGLAALLSSMGLSGALLEFLSSALMIALVVFAIMFIVRRLRGGGARPAMQGAGAGAGAQGGRDNQQAAPMWREALKPAPAPAAPAAAAPVAAAAPAAAAQPVDPSWFIPADFDTQSFLQNAKSRFVEIQKLWDGGDVEALREYLTDDLLAELRPQITANAGQGATEVVLLNAELMGIEQVSGGHLASVRFSGMLREQVGAEAFRFEEVWNLYKAAEGGWLLAGIQQMQVDQAH